MILVMLKLIHSISVVNGQSSNYTHYYHLCNPSVCIYTTVERYHWIHLITYVIGLVGGLAIVLKIFVPSVMKSFIWICGYFSNINRIGFIRSFIGFIRENFVKLNLYERQTSITINPIFATRIYLILLTISIIFPMSTLFLMLRRSYA